jgi:hypothetical protein
LQNFDGTRAVKLSCLLCFAAEKTFYGQKRPQFRSVADCAVYVILHSSSLQTPASPFALPLNTSGAAPKYDACSIILERSVERREVVERQLENLWLALVLACDHDANPATRSRNRFLREMIATRLLRPA